MSDLPIAMVLHVLAAGTGPVMDCFTPGWTQLPMREELAAAFPAEARKLGLSSGVAVLSCIPDAVGAVACKTINEGPAGAGFGEAAMLMSKRLKMQVDPACFPAGRAVSVPMRFEAPS
jgi:hypothetical protein